MPTWVYPSLVSARQKQQKPQHSNHLEGARTATTFQQPPTVMDERLPFHQELSIQQTSGNGRVEEEEAEEGSWKIEGAHDRRRDRLSFVQE
ncbi:hypothetical protein PGT21_031271 [Puccinia graminis f. sp. tritici]|uniref:Uncharacterized protein n=1 Tax=Puccinia graminis f. sp. tritici TaxID=56615 RepID=A0A5B0QXP6_PUCGR|nr:hypothetical protein PGT21_031271 [Puccinia graminis f. sp. tritici]